MSRAIVGAPIDAADAAAASLPSPPAQALTGQAMTGPHASLRPCVWRICVAALTALLLAAPMRSRAQDAEDESAAPSLEETLEAGESAVESPRRQLVRWNEYDGYLSDNIRLELAYGYGTLDRFDLEGTTQFFQSRIQLQF